MRNLERRVHLLLDEPRYRKVAGEARRRRVSVATVIRDAIDAGMARGDIPKRDVTLMASLAYGLVRQVAVSHAQGRAKGKLADRAEPVAAASWLVLSAAAPKPKAKKPLDRR